MERLSAFEDRGFGCQITDVINLGHVAATHHVAGAKLEESSRRTPFCFLTPPVTHKYLP